MGLAVDEIVDIVEDKLDIEVTSSVPGVLGSGIVKGQATEIIDVGHFLPLAFADWFSRNELRSDALTRNLLLVDDSHFFRNMLAPVLKAAGYEVTTATGADEALARLKAGERFDVIVSDIEMPGMNGFEFAAACRADGTWRSTPMVALTSHTTPTDLARGRQGTTACCTRRPGDRLRGLGSAERHARGCAGPCGGGDPPSRSTARP